ncbi:MAG TPA: 23S rRNA (adenine(2503)-C(2))-methyltransferase RlmN [Vampirovibrionales bacterium]
MKTEAQETTQNSDKVSLSGMSKEELIQTFGTLPNWPKYRTDQVISWLYTKSSKTIDEWTNLGASLRKELKDNYEIPLLKKASHLISKQDGTEKFLFQLPDGELVESVLMKFRDRTSLTACISSQVGCAVGCPFCATGKLGFKRNLTAAEIVDQVMSIQRETGETINNLVFMGQGEPFNNLDNLIKAINIFREQVGIGVRHITVSTSGLVPQIIELGKTKLQINLAISLHSAIQQTREKLVPVAKRWPLLELTKALKQHFEDTGRRITFEYTMLKGINDSNEQAWALCDYVRDLPFPCLINLIPFNATDSEFEKPSRKTIDQFKSVVERSGRKVTVRVTLGDDINGACGQLANKVASSQQTAL